MGENHDHEQSIKRNSMIYNENERQLCNSNLKILQNKRALSKNDSSSKQQVQDSKPRRALTDVPVNNNPLSQNKRIVAGSKAAKVRREENIRPIVSAVQKRQIYNDRTAAEQEEEEEEEGEDDDAASIVNKKRRIDAEEVSEIVGWQDLDYVEKDDTAMVAEYSAEIFAFLYRRELETLPSHNYLLDKTSKYYLRPSMRTILVDWLVEVHEKFQCYPETLFLSINLMDRFLAKNKVTMNKLQLLAVTSLFIAAKFEEVNLPKLAEYAYITDGAASKNDIKNAEMFMLTSLEFNIGWPNPLNFLRRISKADDYDPVNRNIGKFILEYAYCCHQFIHLPPSTVSAMAMYIARRMTNRNKNELWNGTLQHYSGGIDPIHDEAFQSLCIDLVKDIASSKTHLDSLILKYKKPRYGSVYFQTFKWCTSEMHSNFQNLFNLK
ncbi:BPK_collapsed_G0056380.mRNA.1.CDS.1 [Saccharomyces cerevisiae]|nr:BPG_G0057390.mRNA.1.CDS.1 [Saccharomyces cerevisiae]CAI7402086.1 BPG_G0057390.mRNA.1.CDS.1 [Saccharomyces cerevisiae]CAI7466599.1 BPK_collapsed_G0056380.mRNA.1.CDS.1 [Saccharomyces cerevisiae]